MTEKSVASNHGGPGHEYDGVKLDDAQVRSPHAKIAASLVISPSKTLNTISPRLFGYNYEWGSFYFYGAVDVVDDGITGVMPVSKNYRDAVAGIPFPLNRMAGSSSQNLIWKKSVGPLSHRADANGKGMPAGPLEWFSATLAADPDAEFVWVLNMTKDSPEDARDFAEFICGAPDTEWGAKRVAYGFPRPLKIAIWELGNELDWGKDKMDVDEYIRRCGLWMDAIRTVCPDAVFAAHAATAPWEERQALIWREWQRKVIAGLGGRIKHIAFHPYYRGHSPAVMFKYVDALVEDLREAKRTGIKLYMSEHSKFPPGGGASSNQANWFHTHSLGGCLDTAEWFLLAMRRPEIECMAYHAFSSGPWGLLYRDMDSNKLYTTGIAELFKLFGMARDTSSVLEISLKGEGTNLSANDFSLVVAALSTPDKSRLLLLSVNRLPATERELSVEIEGASYKLDSLAILSGPDLQSHNSASEAPLKLQRKELTGDDAFKCCVVPARSVVLHFLSRIDG